MIATEFRFDQDAHAYYLGEQRIPSITQMLTKAGLVDATYYTDAGRARGTIVHDITRDMDLGVLQAKDSPDEVRGWALAYEAARIALRPVWDTIEEAEVHPFLRFGGRPDRSGMVLDEPIPTVGEIKSGAKEDHHRVQTALQAILLSARTGVDPYVWRRLCIYVKKNGRFSVDLHERPRDLDEGYRIIKECCL